MHPYLCSCCDRVVTVRQVTCDRCSTSAVDAALRRAEWWRRLWFISLFLEVLRLAWRYL